MKKTLKRLGNILTRKNTVKRGGKATVFYSFIQSK